VSAGATSRYDVPLYAEPKVHRDHHIEVGKALYSIPGNLIGNYVDARADAVLIKLFFPGQLIKVHPAGVREGRPILPSALGEDALTDGDGRCGGQVDGPLELGFGVGQARKQSLEGAGR
jgi:hypothetical protein